MKSEVRYYANSSDSLFRDVDKGDSVWVITRRPDDDTYFLVAELIVHSKTHNPPEYTWDYRVRGDLEESRYFDPDEQRNLEDLIRDLSITTNADRLALSLQGVRRLTKQDHQKLAEVAAGLPEDPRAKDPRAKDPRAKLRLEKALEAALYHGDREAVEGLVHGTQSRLGEDLRRTIREEPNRNRDLVQRLQGMYDGCCQICRWDPVDEYGASLCEGHHIQWLSRGGEDALDNLMLVCPNHHRAIHQCDAPLDWGDMAYDFGAHREAVALNRHLESASI